VGIQIDTQGVVPEILPRAIVMEYCTRFHPFDELSIGVHLRIGLGYTCYYHQGTKLGASFVITPETDFEGEFYCTAEPLDTAEK
jgi:hypothetical protein